MEMPTASINKESRSRKYLKKFRAFDVTYMGEEPVLNILPTDDQETITRKATVAFNWYSHSCDYKKAKEWILDYLRSEEVDKFVIECVSNSDNFSNTAGWIARLLLKETLYMPKKFVDHLNKTIELMKQEGSKSIEKYHNKLSRMHDGRVKAQQNHENKIKELTNDHISELELQVDKFIEKKFHNDFDVKKFLKDKGVIKSQSDEIAVHFIKNWTSELGFALSNSKENSDYAEAYSHWSKKQIEKILEFVRTIVYSAENWSESAPKNIKKPRKPRQKKIKSPSQQTKKLLYRKDFEDLVSVDPTKIVGADQVWVYNVKYRYLGVYNASDSSGFSVKGSTLKNFNTSTSMEKKLRKPKDILKTVLTGGKVSLRKVLDGVKCKQRKLTGRLNGHTIILRAE